MGFTHSGLRRYALFLAVGSAVMFALGVANYANGVIGDPLLTYLAFVAAGLGAVGAATNLALSRAINEEGEFVRRGTEPASATLRRGFPLWVHLPATALVAILFVVVGRGVGWRVAGILLGPLLAIDLIGLTTLPLAAKLDEIRSARSQR